MGWLSFWFLFKPTKQGPPKTGAPPLEGIDKSGRSRVPVLLGCVFPHGRGRPVGSSPEAQAMQRQSLVGPPRPDRAGDLQRGVSLPAGPEARHGDMGAV